MENITGILPLFKILSIFTGSRLVSLPFSNMAGPLGESDGEKEKLIEYADRKRESLDCKYLELRTENGINDKNFIAEEKTDFLNSRIILSNDIDKMWSLINGNARTSVRKAEKAGVGVREGDAEKDIQTFYRLNLITRKRHGTPSFPIGFFKNIIKELKGTKLLFAEIEEKRIASIMISTFKDSVYYMYSVSDDEYKHLCPTDLLLWNAIKRASSDGFRCFDLGRSDITNKGLIFFKEKWAAESRALKYYYLPKSNFVSSRTGFKFNMVNTLFKKLPIDIAKVLGPPLVKRLG